MIAASLSPAHAELIRETSDVLLSADQVVAGTFYAQLFEIAPDTRAMFPDDLEELKLKFADMLATLVGSVGHPEVFAGTVEHLGRRHDRYGVRHAHYEPVGQALMLSLKTALGPRFTDDVRAAWASLYQAIGAGMQRPS